MKFTEQEALEVLAECDAIEESIEALREQAYESLRDIQDDRKPKLRLVE